MAAPGPTARPIDEVMDRASVALVERDYYTCERLSLDALTMAHQAGDWSTYARVVLPLQEARRQRRMNASDGGILLGTQGVAGALESVLRRREACCVVVTPPRGGGDAQELLAVARGRRLWVEVLLGEPIGESVWRVRSAARQDVWVDRPAPPAAWVDRWTEPGERWAQGRAAGISSTPADWFLDATEALGDAAMAKATEPVGSVARVAEVEELLEVFEDHEKLHQLLAGAARAAGEHASA